MLLPQSGMHYCLHELICSSRRQGHARQLRSCGEVLSLRMLVHVTFLALLHRAAPVHNADIPQRHVVLFIRSCLCPLQDTAEEIRIHLTFTGVHACMLHLCPHDDSGCRGVSGQVEAHAFQDLMDFIQAPNGCRHAQLSQQFSQDNRKAPDCAALDGICHGGCDVCDTRLAALRDLSTPARHILQAIADAPGGLSQQALLQKLVHVHSTPRQVAQSHILSLCSIARVILVVTGTGDHSRWCK